MFYLPYPSLHHSVAVLDRVRLGNMRLACGRTLAALRSGHSPGWVDHRATDMWRGHESALAVLTTLARREWAARGYHDDLSMPYDEDWRRAPLFDQYPIERSARDASSPDWLGSQELHSAHRRTLMHLAPDYYGALGWGEEAELCTMWTGEVAKWKAF